MITSDDEKKLYDIYKVLDKIVNGREYYTAKRITKDLFDFRICKEDDEIYEHMLVIKKDNFIVELSCNKLKELTPCQTRRISMALCTDINALLEDIDN